MSDVVESCDPDMVTPLDCVMNMCRFSDFALSEARAKDFEEEWLMDAPGLGDTMLREQLEVDLKDFDDDLMDLLELIDLALQAGGEGRGERRLVDEVRAQQQL